MSLFRGVALPIGLSAEDWPVVVYTAPPSIEDEEFRCVLNAMIEVRSLDEPYAMVLDLRYSRGISPLQRKMITDSMSGDDERRERLVRGVALVFASKLLSGLLTAIFWVRRPNYEVKVFSSLAPALSWASAQTRGRRAAVG